MSRPRCRGARPIGSPRHGRAAAVSGSRSGGGGVAAHRHSVRRKSLPGHVPRAGLDRQRHGSCSSTRPSSSIATGSTAPRKGTTPTTRSASQCSAAARSNTPACASSDRRLCTPTIGRLASCRCICATVLQRRSGPRRRARRVDHPQPGVSGTVRARHPARGSAWVRICFASTRWSSGDGSATSKAASSSATR